MLVIEVRIRNHALATTSSSTTRRFCDEMFCATVRRPPPAMTYTNDVALIIEMN
jgi:hypothetical protein